MLILLSSTGVGRTFPGEGRQWIFSMAAMNVSRSDQKWWNFDLPTWN